MIFIDTSGNAAGCLIQPVYAGERYGSLGVEIQAEIGTGEY